MANLTTFVSILSLSAARKINVEILKYKENKGNVVPIKSVIHKLLIDEGAARRRKLHPKQVAVHPKNRDGEMITMSGVYARAEKLDGVGFCLEELEKETVFIFCFDMLHA